MTDHDRKVREAEQARDEAKDAWLEAGKHVKELRAACAHPFEIAAAIKERDRLLKESDNAMDAYGEAVWARDAEQDCHSEL